MAAKPNYGERGWLYTTKGEQRIVTTTRGPNRRQRRAHEKRRPARKPTR